MRVGIVDTTFARADMGKMVADEIADTWGDITILRRTVPGIKDLPVACKRLLAECDICIACGMPGAQKKDSVCAHEASLGIILAQLMSEKHIIEVFVHEDEALNDKELLRIVEDRCKKHAKNAIYLIKDPGRLSGWSGAGKRQGSRDKKTINH